MATKSYLAVLVDLENNADGWWTALREHYPRFARVLSHDGHAVIARNLWAQLEALPGFADGPDYAPTALMTVAMRAAGGRTLWPVVSGEVST